MLLSPEEIWDIIGELDTTYEEDLMIVAKAQLKKVVDGRPREFDGEVVKLHFTRIEWQALLKEVT